LPKTNIDMVSCWIAEPGFGSSPTQKLLKAFPNPMLILTSDYVR